MAYKVTDTVIVDQSRNLGSIGVATFAGPLLIGGGSSTGTVSQPLQVLGTNGAYIGGNLGIGSTNPSSKLSVIGDATFSGIVTSSGLNVRKDPGTGIATDFTNSLFGNGWRLSAPGSTTYYLLATLPAGGGGNTFDHLRIEGTLGAWTNDNQTPFDISFSNRGAFDYKYISYGSVRSDVRIVGISTNSTIQIWAQHQASVFTKLVYNITESIQAIVVSNPTSTTTAPVGTTVFDSSTVTPRFIINESDNIGIGTTNPITQLHLSGFSTTNSNLKIGSLEFQNYSLNNSFFGDNVYWNGSQMVRRSDGKSGLFYFIGDEGQFRLSPVGLANSATVNNPQFKINSNGGFGIGSSLSQGPNDFTGSNFYVNPDGIVLVGTISSTGTASQRLQVSGGAYFAGVGVATGSIGVGITNPQGALDIRTSPQWGGTNIGANLVIGGSRNNGIGILDFANSNPWSISNNAGNLLFSQMPALGNTANVPTEAARITSNRNLLIGTTSETGTASQPLQVTGGAYVSGSVGIGTTNPQRKLHLRATGTDGIFLDNSDQTGNSGAPTLRVRGQRVDSNASQSFSGQLVLEKWRMDALINSGQNLGAIIFGGNFDTLPGITTGMTYGASIGAVAEGTFSNINTAPTAIVFNTGTVGLGTLTLANATYGTEAARITSNRNLLIGSTSATGTASQPLQVTGGAYVSGNLGIGNTNPGTTLDVTGDIRLSAADPEIEFNTGGPRLKVPTANQLSVHTGGGLNTSSSEVVRLTSTGVGIGTTNPTSSLDVRGNINVTGIITTSGSSGVGIGSFLRLKPYLSEGGEMAFDYVSGNIGYFFDVTGTQQFRFGNYDASGTYIFVTNSTEKVRITNAGSLGIGSASPIYTLDVVGSGGKVGTATTYTIFGADVGRNIEIGIGATNISTFLDFHGADLTYSDYAARLLRNGGDNANFDIINRGTGALRLVAQDAGTIDIVTQNTFRHRIDSNGVILVGTATSTGTASQPLQVTGGAYVSGNLGIGTTNPTSTLQVQGNALITGVATVTSNFTVNSGTLYGDAANNRVGINTLSPAFTADIAGDARVTSTNKMRFGGTAGTTNFYIQYNSTANSLDFVAG